MQPSSICFPQAYFCSGNKVTPLADATVTPDNLSDDIFDQVRCSIEGAQESVQIEMYKLTQMKIAQMLVRKRQEGKAVQIILDRDLDPLEPALECFLALRDAGVEVLTYPIQPGDSHHHFKQIDHVKMLIVDGREAILGGMNWGTHSPLDHDMDVKIEGPAVAEMEAIFNLDYLKAGGQDLLPIKVPEPHPEGTAQVAVLTTSEKADDREIQAALLQAIRQSEKSIHAEMFYLTDQRIVDGLIEARQRGVDVQLLLDPGQKRRRAMENLRAGGCEALWYVSDTQTKSKLHAKLGIFDGREVIVGSANWTHNGMEWNREADVDILDETVAARFEDIFRRDFAKGVYTPPNRVGCRCLARARFDQQSGDETPIEFHFSHNNARTAMQPQVVRVTGSLAPGGFPQSPSK